MGRETHTIMLGESFLQFRHFLPQLSDDLLVSSDMEVDVEDVSLDSQFDVLRTIRVFQCVVRVFVGDRRRGNCGNHHCQAIATQ